MAKIASKITDLIGNTPLLELSRFGKLHKLKSPLIAKLEYFNPGRSVKDRIGFALITDAEDRGLLKQNGVIIEPTSGNTGIALAIVAASKGYKIILTMPESMSMERRNILKGFGAELVLTPAPMGMKGAIQKAEELKDVTPNSFMQIGRAHV